MRLLLCNEVLRTLSLQEQCAFAKAVGYDGLEIAPFTLSDEPHRTSSERRAELRRAAAEEGMEISGLHYVMLAPAGLSITSEDAAVRAKTIDVGRGLIDLCAEIGGKYLVHGSPDQRRLEAGREEQGRRLGEDYFAQMAQAAEKAGMIYLVEPLSPAQTNFVTSISEALSIVRRIDNPFLKTMIDCSAAGRGEAEAIPDLLRRHLPDGLIAHVHFNDPNGRGPGEGDLAFAPIVQALEEMNYPGAIGVEPFVYKPDGPSCAARAAGYVRALMSFHV